MVMVVKKYLNKKRIVVRMKRGWILIVALVILSSFAYADTVVFNKDFNQKDTFRLDDIPYEMTYSFTSDMIAINSPFQKLLLEKNSCKTEGYYSSALQILHLM
jgi:hypothetical protein